MEWRFCDPRYFRLDQLISSGRKLNITQLCREMGFTNAHLSVVFDHWFECGIIDRIKKGQDTYIEFTEFGREMFKAEEKFAQLANQAIKNREKRMEEKG